MFKQEIRLAAVSFAVTLFGFGVASASDSQCKKIASVQLEACKTETRADFLIASANCSNLAEKDERKECAREAKGESAEVNELCHEQKDARRALCEALREDRYDPDFDPDDFETDFVHPAIANPHFPLAVGYRWHYSSPDEETSIEVKDETKQIEGVTCAAVRDLVVADGAAVEDTDDWFALRQDGTIVYCGEISQSFELFEGDQPARAELVSLEGSWKTGRDGALPGILFPGSPAVGAIYRQELARGTAEDVAKVLSTTYAFGRSMELDRLVPGDLARLLCGGGNCVVTREFSPISPGSFERKYYAPGVGLFLEVNPSSGEVVRLTDCNFAPVCKQLP